MQLTGFRVRRKKSARNAELILQFQLTSFSCECSLSSSLWCHSSGLRAKGHCCQSVLLSAYSAAPLLHNVLLICVKMCLFFSNSSLNLNLKVIRSRSEREERKKDRSAILGSSEPFPSKVTFQTKCLRRYLGHGAPLTFSETSSLLCSLPLLFPSCHSL